ncbi:TRAP transporter permease [Planctomycetaceae bacterium SH139]
MSEIDVAAPADRGLRRWLIPAISGALSIYVLLEVNFSQLSPLKGLALFASAGLILCFLLFPTGGRWIGQTLAMVIDWTLILLTVVCCGYLLYNGAELGQRAGIYETRDLVIGGIGLLLVIEATRRSIGWALPILALLFVIYAHQSVAQQLPDWLFPHRGQDVGDLIGQTYLRTEGVFGTALGVMFKYVFLFVLFGSFLEASGATGYIIALATRLFGKKAGGPAKVSVLASGLMGSLSGSAVANAATTGTFTIPLMRSIGFRPHIAAGIEAAASSGGALVPPVMGAGAYMMLEIINRTPPVTYLEIVQAALIPAILYYLSIFLLVHFYAKRIDARPAEAAAESGGESPDTDEILAAMSPQSQAGGTGRDGAVEGASSYTSEVEADAAPAKVISLEGITFFGALGSLMMFLLAGNSPFRSVTYSLALVMVMIIINPRTAASFMQRVAALLVWAISSLLAWQLIAVAATWPDALIWGMAATLLAGLLVPAWRGMIVNGFCTSGRGGVPLIVAAACVGIIIGLVSRTGIGTGVPQAIIPLAGNSLFLALLAIMGCSIILGMGLPSAVSYLLLATVIGPVFADPALGVPILAAHLFIFYFGMMAMVTPPVALAAYATASIAGSGVMQTGLAAFRFSLVGFTLPYMFVYRPELCLMSADGSSPAILSVVLAVVAAVIGILSLAAGMAGYLLSPLSWPWRIVLFAAAACSLYPDQATLGPTQFSLIDIAGAGLLGVVVCASYLKSKRTIGG